MRRLPIFAFVLFLSSLAAGQEILRTQEFEKIIALRAQLKAVEDEFLRPTAGDLSAAVELGLKAFRLMPREKFDKVLTIRGGGSYYSFARIVQEYGYGSDISLQEGSFKVGFAGPDYGFLYDLGKVSLSEVSRNTKEARFLVTYKPPVNLKEIRSELSSRGEYAVDGLVYRSYVPATVEHTYILRSINFDSTDILVAFTVVRKDPDGSLIIFWKAIESFEIPKINRVQNG